MINFRNAFATRQAIAHWSFAILFLALPAQSHFASAQTIQWSSVHPTLTWTAAEGRFKAGLNSPIVTVTYGVQATEIDNLGNPIRPVACGTSVPVGTHVLFEFLPHQFSDISWFGSGFASDSPYGAWLAGVPAPLERCAEKNLYDDQVRARGLVDLYAELAVAPPQKVVTVSGAQCNSIASGRSCVLDHVGSVSADYTFASTTGYFWGGFTHGPGDAPPPRCYANTRGAATEPMKEGATPYVVAVPQQAIQCPISVVEARGEPPNVPVLNLGGSGPQCVVGDAHTITMSSVDPDGDRVRFLIDWNNDYVADDMLPPAGYIASGEQARATRTFVTAGQKRVNVLAQDEHGRASAWTAMSITCAARPEADRSKFPNADDILGGSDDASSLTGQNGESGLWGNGPFDDLDLRVKPSLVRVGQRTMVFWRSQRMETCAVASTNGDRWASLSSPLGGAISEPITKRTVFTLTCQNGNGDVFTRSAPASTVPSWQEQ